MTAEAPPTNTTAEARAGLYRGFRVGDWNVHPPQGVIEQGTHRVHIEPKVMDVLVCLAAHTGQVVSRDMLLGEVWKGVVVTDDVVTRCISELRTVLRDTGRDRRFIRTIPKRGYSLMAAVEPLVTGKAGPASVPSGGTPRPDTPPPTATSVPTPIQRAMDGATRAARQTVATTRNLIRSALLGIGLLIVIVVALAVLFGDDDGIAVELDMGDEQGLDVPARPPAPSVDGAASIQPSGKSQAAARKIRSVAVLPLVNLSGDPEHEYFSDGLAEDIRGALIGVPDLRVAARTSSVAFRNRPMDVREIARQLNVEALLEGTVRIEGARLRVTTQLTDGRTGYPIWASSFERPVTDKLALQTEVAEAIIGQVSPSIANGGRVLAAATGNEQAHDAYLLGRYYWNQRTRDGIERSVGYFEQALTRDPGYALAYSGLADAWSLMADNNYRRMADAAPKARRYARKALELDPDLAEAHASLGMVYRLDGDLQGARAEYQKAVNLQPGYSMAQMWLGVLMFGLGDANQAYARLVKALELDPLHPAVQVNYVGSLIARGDVDRAREEGRRLLALTPNEKLNHTLWQVSLEQGNYDDVLADALVQAGSVDSVSHLSDGVIESLIYLQRYTEAAQLIQASQSKLPSPRRLSLEASLAVARRDAPTLRRLAAELVSPATSRDTPPLNQGCIQQWSGLWLGIADLLDRKATAARHFRDVASDGRLVICEHETPAFRLIALAYAVETTARLNAAGVPAAAADARKEIARLRALGWNDAWFGTAEIAVAMLAGDNRGAATLLRDFRRRGLRPYGRMRTSPLFDRLWDRPPLNAVRAEIAAEYEATQKRAAGLQLAKLGLQAQATASPP